MQDRRGRRGEEPVEQRLVLVRPQARDERDRQVLDPAREHPERLQAAGVGPVDVVDHDQQRLLGGEVGDPLVQRVQPRVVGVDRRGLEAREQLADDPEREVALQVGADRAERAQAGGARLGADGAQQRRLALAGGRLDERDRAAAVPRGIELRAERVQLRFPLQQLGVGDGDHLTAEATRLTAPRG